MCQHEQHPEANCAARWRWQPPMSCSPYRVPLYTKPLTSRKVQAHFAGTANDGALHCAIAPAQSHQLSHHSSRVPERGGCMLVSWPSHMLRCMPHIVSNACMGFHVFLLIAHPQSRGLSLCFSVVRLEDGSGLFGADPCGPALLFPFLLSVAWSSEPCGLLLPIWEQPWRERKGEKEAQRGKKRRKRGANSGAAHAWHHIRADN